MAGRQYVAVVRIGQVEAGDPVLVCSHKRVWSRLVHQAPGALQLRACQVGAVCQQVPDPLLMHRAGPVNAQRANERQMHQQIPQLGGIEHVGVAEDDERTHSSNTDLLVVGGKFGENGAALGVRGALVRHQ